MEILGFTIVALMAIIVVMYLLIKVKNDEIDRLQDEVISLKSKIKAMIESYEAEDKMRKVSNEPPPKVPDSDSGYQLGDWD